MLLLHGKALDAHVAVRSVQSVHPRKVIITLSLGRLASLQCTTGTSVHIRWNTIVSIVIIIAQRAEEQVKFVIYVLAQLREARVDVHALGVDALDFLSQPAD